MRKISFCLIFIASLCRTEIIFSQAQIFTAGFQYKPIFTTSFLGSDTKSIAVNAIDFSISQKNGYSAGMILRRGFTKQLSFETGINYTKRNFDLLITDTSFTGKSDFTIIAYEIPIQGLIFLRLADKLYMNASLGISIDMYPSDIVTKDTYFKHYSIRHSLFQFAALANLGFEYRTEKSGYFYFGSSYHLPLSYIYSSSMMYNPTRDIGRLTLSGTFLTLDFRYYFHEDPLKPKKKKKK